MSMRTELLWPRHNLVAVQDALRYTFGILRPAGFAGLGARAWRNAETQKEATKREFQSPATTRL